MSSQRTAYLAAIFHLALFAGMAFLLRVSSRTEGDWGGPGGCDFRWNCGQRAGSRAAIPLPQPDTVTENRVVDETKGLYKAEPPPKPEAATPLRCRNSRRISRRSISPSRRRCWRIKLRRRRTRCLTAEAERRRFPTLRHNFHDGQRRHAGGMGFSGSGGRKFRTEIFLVRGSGAAPCERQLAAVHRRPGNSRGAAGRHCRFRSCVTERWRTFRFCNRVETRRSILRRCARCGNPTRCSRLPGDYSGGYVSVDFYFDFRRRKRVHGG